MERSVKTAILAVAIVIFSLTECALAQRSNNNDLPFPPVTNNNIFGNPPQREPPRDIFGNTINQQTPNPRDGNNNNNFNNFPNNQNNNQNNNNNNNNNRFDPSQLPTRQDTFNPFSRPRDPFGQYTPRLDISDASFSFSAGNEEKRCPERWDTFKESCYRFVQSPTHTRLEAQRNCQV